MYLLKTRDKTVLTVIHNKCHRDPVDRCRSLLDKWKEITPKSSCQWEQVIAALRKVSLIRLASELEEALSRGSGRADHPNDTSTSRIGNKHKSHTHKLSERDSEADSEGKQNYCI